MKRALLLACLSTVVACRLPPEREPLRPLAEDGAVFSYDEILSRARVQATVALEAFYIDNWGELDEAAQGLEQTARFLTKATHPPEQVKTQLAGEADILKAEAVRLRHAARTRNVTTANQALQRIHFQIRKLRPGDTPAPK